MAYWPESCARGELLLNLGSVIQAVVTPLLVFMLPGPGAIFRRKLNSPQLSRRSLLVTICLCVAAIPLAWWYGLRQYAGTRGVCLQLFDLSPASDPFHRDYVKDCAYYFTYLSSCTAVWAGVAAGGLRLQSARVSARLQAKSTEFQTFCWVCLLAWAVQYRLSEWFGLLWARQGQEWSFEALLTSHFLRSALFGHWRLRAPYGIQSRGRCDTRFCEPIGERF